MHFLCLERATGLQKPADTAQSVHTQDTEGGLDSTHGRDTHRYNLCLRKHQASIDPAQRATEHVCTPIWERLQCSPGPKSLANQTLMVSKNQCLQAQGISMLCIHTA